MLLKRTPCETQQEMKVLEEEERATEAAFALMREEAAVQRIGVVIYPT